MICNNPVDFNQPIPKNTERVALRSPSPNMMRRGDSLQTIHGISITQIPSEKDNAISKAAAKAAEAIALRKRLQVFYYYHYFTLRYNLKYNLIYLV